jgi:predicted metalloprotease
MANWGKIGSRGDVEDRRSMVPVVAGGVSLAGVALYLLVNYLSGGSLSDALGQLGRVAIEDQQTASQQSVPVDDSYREFAATVLGSNNDWWEKVLAANHKTYTPPRMVLFRQATESGCGTATSDVGPFYCSADGTIYLDEMFFDELVNRFQAKGGDVAEAYVMAHEVGHHVQNLLGTFDQVERVEQRNPRLANEVSVKMELQADCFAGMWANSIQNMGVLEPGEIGEAMDAAAAVGDDRVQEAVTGYVNPESFTHGSAAERLSWFDKGYEIPSLESCDTFK